MDFLRRGLLFISLSGLLFTTSCAMNLTKENVFGQSISVTEDSRKAPKITDTIIHGQEFKLTVSFAWEAEGGAGEHKRTWKYYKEGKYFGENKQLENMYRSPYNFTLNCKSIDKEAGDYEYEFYLDDMLMTTFKFKIVQSE